MVDGPSVIVVEDNQALREELVHYLAEDGFAVQGVDGGEELDDVLRSSIPDILVLDLNMAMEDGIHIATRMRSALPRVGIVILTGRVRSSERHEGYSSGADVYLTKPTPPAELATVLRNLFRRLTPPKVEEQWCLDMSRLLLRVPGMPDIRLTGTEARLLREFALRGQYLEHWILISRLGDLDAPESVNLARIEVLISRLRRKVQQMHGGESFIKSLRGTGYQLRCPISLEDGVSVSGENC